MGLNISHDAFSGAYSAFDRFRRVVCKATGGHWCDEVSAPRLWMLGEGYNSKSHPGLYELLVHSDCNGKIDPELAAALADELEQLLPAIDRAGKGVGHIARNGGYGSVARQLIKGCRLAASKNEPLEFL